LTFDRARVDLIVLSQSRDGFWVGDVTTSTMSPCRSTWRRGTSFPFTRAPAQWLPTSVCTAYAKSIGVEPSGRAFTSPLGVKTYTSSGNRSSRTVSRNSFGSSTSLCDSSSCRSHRKASSKWSRSLFFSL
jgi:hypothetical protein